MTRKEILEWGHEMADKIFHKKKDEKEITINGWATRDEGSLRVIISSWEHKPKKLEHEWDRHMSLITIRSLLELPSVKWEDEEPTPCEITIKLKK